MFAHEGHNARYAVGTGEGVFILPAVNNIRHVANVHSLAVMVGNNNFFNIVDIAVFANGTHGYFHVVVSGFAARRIVVFVIYFLQQVLKRNPVFH